MGTSIWPGRRQAHGRHWVHHQVTVVDLVEEVPWALCTQLCTARHPNQLPWGANDSWLSMLLLPADKIQLGTYRNTVPCPTGKWICRDAPDLAGFQQVP